MLMTGILEAVILTFWSCFVTYSTYLFSLIGQKRQFCHLLGQKGQELVLLDWSHTRMHSLWTVW